MFDFGIFCHLLRLMGIYRVRPPSGYLRSFVLSFFCFFFFFFFCILHFLFFFCLSRGPLLLRGPWTLSTHATQSLRHCLECVTLLFHAQSAKAEVWLKALGLMASLVDLVPYCRLRMRPIQLHLLYHFNLKFQSMDTLVPMSQIVQEELGWWMVRSNLTACVRFPSPPP